MSESFAGAPQVAPQFVVNSALANAESGFVDVDRFTLRHVRSTSAFDVGIAGSTLNARTMAAARKQAPIVAINALTQLDAKQPVADYDGYVSCPLTVGRGKIVLTDFGYDGKLLPSFPKW